MIDHLDHVIKTLADSLMRAVVRSGCIRQGRAADFALAAEVMRDELKRFIVASYDAEGGRAPKYEDHRALARTGGTGLVMAELAAECICRILAEREN